MDRLTTVAGGSWRGVPGPSENSGVQAALRRRQVDEDELFKTFVYSGKWKAEYVHSMHLYNKELPIVLLIDPLGYIRWHAVGLPSPEATVLFRSLSRQLAFEKRSHA